MVYTTEKCSRQCSSSFGCAGETNDWQVDLLEKGDGVKCIARRIDEHLSLTAMLSTTSEIDNFVVLLAYDR